MAEKGIHVKALDNVPELFEAELFYHKMFNLCGTDFQKISMYCGLHGMSPDEVIEAIEIMAKIQSGL